MAAADGISAQELLHQIVVAEMAADGEEGSQVSIDEYVEGWEASDIAACEDCQVESDDFFSSRFGEILGRSCFDERKVKKRHL